MAYQSLYRKYRPQTFADVVGQGHVVRTLQNALASGKIAHGYLFTGTRGTAKTTVARLLAKSLNCLAQSGPTTEPCNRCEACLSIVQGNCIDVIEMDAASHRGVADIEEVRKAVGYGPMQFRYKVFIIDEAHQLSSDAKDAFLKTLEEPPPGVVFVLATTEPQAIPITIRSRCQQFDFKRGSLADISARLAYVLDSEGVTYTPEALALVARGAEGSYRDSLSLLEQVLSFASNHVEASDVETVLGSLDAEVLGRLAETIAKKDAPGALALTGEILDAGKEARSLLKSFSAHLRDLLLVSVGGPAAATELSPDEAARLQGQAKWFQPSFLLQAMDAVNGALGELRYNNQHRLLVELTLLKLMTLSGGDGQFQTAPIVFSEAPKVAAKPATKAAPNPTPAPPPPPPAPEPTPEPAPELSLEPELDPAYFADDVDPDDEDEFAPSVIVTEAEPTVDSGLGLFDAVEEEPEPEPEPEPTPTPPVVTEKPAPVSLELLDMPPPPDDLDMPPAPLEDDAPPPPVAEEERKPRRRAPVAPVVEEERKAPEKAPDLGLTLDLKKKVEEAVVVEQADPRITLPRVQQVWSQFLSEASRFSKRASVMMNAAIPTDVQGRTVVLTFHARMNYDMMNAPKQQEFVRKLLARVLAPELEGVPVRFVLDEGVAPAPHRSVERQKLRRDPIQQLADEALKSAPIPSDNGGWAPAPTNAWNPPIRPAVPHPAVTARIEAERFQEPERQAVPSFAAAPAPPLAVAVAKHNRTAVALEEQLVQDILSTFGGELIEE